MGSRRWLVAAIVVVVLVVIVGLPFAGWLARVWTDYLWYSDVGQSGVFVTRIVSQLAVGAVFAVVALLVLFATLRSARSLAPAPTPITLPPGTPEQLAMALEGVRRRISPILDKAILVASLWFAFTNGAAISSEWETFRIALERARFGMVDPQFGRDLGFYLFTMPALEATLSWLTGLLVLATVLALVVHVLDGALQPWKGLRDIEPHVKAHVSVLLAGFVLLRAFGYWLAIWNLNLSPRGQVLGASYTDVHAQLPAYWILIGVSLLTGLALLLNIRYRGWRLPLVALGAWVALSVLLGGVWPALLQQFRVSPNELALEAPYIKRNISMTRYAFGLSDLEGRSFPASNDLTAADVTDKADTLSNVRLWDPNIVAQSYSQLQSIRSYYDFKDVDVDRYKIGGRERQVLISARELNSGLLDAKAQNWVNQHLVYTHGFGIVMSPVNEADTRGLPRFVLGDIPPKVSSSVASATAGDLEVKQPRIYFGEDTGNYVIVDTGKEEFDYPKGSGNAYFTYGGQVGPEIGGFVRRLAWAMRLGSSQVLFSQYVKPDSRVLMNRDVLTRVKTLAPWLTFEDDPYITLVDGRLTWIVDAYTHSERFPYSERLENGTNYLRNSVKVTVDAYTGKTTFYAFDPKDPVLRAWRGVFPDLITDGSKIPAEVAKHFRYPQGLFEAQAEVYRTYHMTDVNVFYNKEDQWQIPGERQGKMMEPFFVLLRLPGATKEHFYLMQPYTPRNKDNMIGWIAASSDPENYGERTVFLFPKDRVILGPEQVTARINQDPVISPQLSLWNQRGSQVLFGNMQVIPIRDSVVYIQPLFLQAQQTAIPELTRVVVAYADRVEMARTLQDALLQVFGGDTATPGSGESTVTPGAGAGGGSGVAADAATAQKLYEQALDAQKQGDWAEYGRLIEQLGKVLDQLAGSETSATP